MNYKKECLLIISKRFYSLEKYIRENIEAKEYKVTVANDEYPEGVIGKLLGKLNIPILIPITNYVISKKFINNKKYDIVLIIKGRGIGKSVINKLKISSKKVIGFTWDSFKYNKAPLRWYKYVSRFYTFDYRDAEKYNLPVVELFSSSGLLKEEKTSEFDISAIFRNHSGRLKYLDRILGILKPQQKYIYIYEQNIFFFVLNFFSNPSLYLKYIKYIHYKPLNYNEYFCVLEKSQFTIDYAHPYQTGITIRCFEALSKKTRIISNNPYIKNSSFFNSTNTIVFAENDKSDKLLSDYDAITSKIPSFQVRLLSNFIDDLIMN